MEVKSIILLTMFIISIIDIKTRTIPNWITITGMLAGLIYNHFGMNFIIGIIAGIGIVHCLNTARIFKTAGGDAKLLGFIGAFVGWRMILIIYGVSILFAVPFIIYRMGKNRKGHYAYSPFITMASLALFFYAR